MNTGRLMNISVVVTGFNISNYVEVSMGSVINQTLSPYEVIFVDDGSTDGTSDDALLLMKKLHKWQLVIQDNRGPGGARNTGLRASTGDYILFLDGDDWLELDALANLSAALTNGQDAVFSNRSVFSDDSGRLKSSVTFDSSNSGSVKAGRNLLRLFAIHGKLFKRQFLIENNIFFPEKVVWEDYPFSYNVLAFAKEIATIAKNTYIYRRRSMQNVSFSKGRRLTPFYFNSRRLQFYNCSEIYPKLRVYGKFPNFDFKSVDVNRRLMADIAYLIRESDASLVGEAFERYKIYLSEQSWILDHANPENFRILLAIKEGDFDRSMLLLRQTVAV